MNVISLGSNCEVSHMFLVYLSSIIPNARIYSHLLAWSTIKINNIRHFLENPAKLSFDNFVVVYKLFSNGNTVNLSKNGHGYTDFNHLLEDMKDIPNIESIHIDVEYTFEDIYFWTHGTQVAINNFDQHKINDYLNDVKSKTTHLIDKTLSIKTDNDIKVFCIKCLKGNYSLQDIIDLNSLLLNYSANNYMSVIVEEDENINFDDLKLVNTCIVRAPKLTEDHEAVFTYRYNTDFYYRQLFEETKKMLNV